MSSTGLSSWLLVGMVVIGIYVLPSVTAKFQGSHTMEFNATSNGVTNASGMKCGECHAYIKTELNATGTAGTDRVLQQHINALEEPLYANVTDDDGEFLKIGTFSGITTDNVCPLCHATETSINGSHTQVVTRVCTDPDCHGYNSTAGGNPGPPVYADGQNITEKLNKSTDVHSGWYWAMEQVDSDRPMANASYPNEHGGDYGQGYLTCLACHTHFGMNMNITRPQSFNINISIDEDGTVTVDGTNLAINQTDKNTTFSVKEAHQTVWN